MSPDEIIPCEDPRFAEVLAAARALVAAAQAVAAVSSEPGAEALQASHYAFTALVNAVELSEHDTIQVLGMFIGSTAEAFEQPFESLELLYQYAFEGLNETMRRRSLMIGHPEGRA